MHPRSYNFAYKYFRLLGPCCDFWRIWISGKSAKIANKQFTTRIGPELFNTTHFLYKMDGQGWASLVNLGRNDPVATSMVNAINFGRILAGLRATIRENILSFVRSEIKKYSIPGRHPVNVSVFTSEAALEHNTQRHRKHTHIQP